MSTAIDRNPTRCIIYARYSSENQKDASIEDQIRTCSVYAAKMGWLTIGTLYDRAISGSTDQRDGYQQLIQACRGGLVDVVLAEGLDRLSRDQEHVAGLFKEARYRRVRVVTLAEGEINEMHIGLKGTMNALFLKDLARKVVRGMEGQVLKGKSGGGLPYGYRVVRSFDARGDVVAGEREIDDAQADVIRRVFREYVSGVSPRQIAKRLNEEGIAGPRGGGWTASMLLGNETRGLGLLRNALYSGVLVWNRQTFIRDPHTGKRQSRPNPRESWIRVDVPILRIVAADVWSAAQSRLAKSRLIVTEQQ
jgi:DNA invertase Pin-like site-specific DNA recombinase